MANFNTKAFMDSISAEMQEKVKACKTPEELQALTDANNIDLNAFAVNVEEDVELSLEDLEGVGGGKGIAPVALAAVMAFSALTAATLTGCGTVGTSSSTSTSYTNTTEATSTGAGKDNAAKIEGTSQNTNNIQSASKAAEKQVQAVKLENNGSSAAENSYNNIGVDQETAINAVYEEIGYGSTIISCTKGTSPEGFNCWIVVATPANTSLTVTYYSGYQFCYSVDNPNNADTIGIDRDTAINNVKYQLGYDAEIISCTKGYSAGEGFNCWIIVAKPANSTKTYTYYSGYQFCYSYERMDEMSDTNAIADSNGFFSESDAIRIVREQVGSGANIISCTKGTDPNGTNCWVVVVEPVTNGNGPERVTYYTGYGFCYKAADSQQSDGQNPMMNFIGNYTNGRAMMNVSCIGRDQAAVTITWGGSALNSATWTMSGPVQVSNEGISFSYSNCTKEVVSYAEDGTLISDTVEYQGGSGSIDFLTSDNNAYWYDSQENASNGESFWYFNE